MNQGTLGGDVIAVDIGATHLRTARISASGETGIIRKNNLREACRSADDITGSVLTAISDLLQETSSIQVRAIGIAAAGPLDISRGAIVHSPNMPFEQIDLTGPLRDAFGLPVHLINDCSAGALAEVTFGPLKGTDNLVYITISSGIGAGVISDGKLVIGHEGNAAEVGHMCVDTTWNIPCGCGGTGHWEAYASGTGIPAFFRRWTETHFPEHPRQGLPSSAQEIFDFILHREDFDGFPGALAAINGRGLSNVIAAYEPQYIVFDGPVIREHADLLIGPMLKQTDRYLKLPGIKISTLGGHAPLLGAAAYALEKGLIGDVHRTL